MISKTFTHLSQYFEEERGKESGDNLFETGPELSHPGSAPLFPAFASPHSHQFDTHWGNQQNTTIPGTQEAFQYNNCWASQQTTTTIAAQKATLGQNHSERIEPSIAASTLYHQLADEQSLDIPRATNLHTALEIPPDGPNSNSQPSDTFSVPFDPHFVNKWFTDTSVSHEELSYGHIRASIRKTDSSPSQTSSPSVLTKTSSDEASASSWNSTNLGESSTKKSGAAFQCPTCNKSFSHRHQLK